MKRIISACISCLLLSLVASKSSDPAGSFELIVEQDRQRMDYSAAKGNHLFGKTYGNYIWVRLAQSPEKDGEAADHLDIDIWNYDGPGTYLPADPKANKREDKRWNIWWHGADQVFVNEAEAQHCKLILSEEEGMLRGKFECKQMMLNNGKQPIGIENGSFLVKPEPGN